MRREFEGRSKMKVFAEASATQGRNTLPSHVAAVAAVHGLEALDADGIRDARALAAQLIGEGIATDGHLAALQAHFGASIFGLRQDGALCGLLAAFPLNEAGLEAVEQGRFNAVALDLALVARAGEQPTAYYGWGFAATNKDGARAVLKASVDIHRLLYWAVPTFARAVTADGVRALQSIGFIASNQDGLFQIPPNMISAGVRA